MVVKWEGPDSCNRFALKGSGGSQDWGGYCTTIMKNYCCSLCNPLAAALVASATATRKSD